MALASVSPTVGFGLGVIGDSRAVLCTDDGGIGWHPIGRLPVEPVPPNRDPILSFVDAHHAYRLPSPPDGIGGLAVDAPARTAFISDQGLAVHVLWALLCDLPCESDVAGDPVGPLGIATHVTTISSVLEAAAYD